MRVSLYNNYKPAFKAEADNTAVKPKNASASKPVYDKNPIKKSGERSTAILATVGAGLIAGVRLLAAIADDGDGAQFIGEMTKKVSNKIIKRNMKPGEKITLINKIGGHLAVIAGFIAICAAVYTIYNMPKALYTADVKTFKKKKEMDVYIKGNAVEKELYNQMNEKAKTAAPEEKAKLNEQYAKLKAAKNVVPDFVKLNQPELQRMQLK